MAYSFLENDMLHPPLTKFIDDLTKYAASSLEATAFGSAYVSTEIVKQLREKLTARAELNLSFIKRIYSEIDRGNGSSIPNFDEVSRDLHRECERFLCDLRHHITRYTYFRNRMNSLDDEIVSVDLNISDRHFDGSAARITTKSGFYVSKHREPHGDRFFDAYAEILSQKGVEPAFKVPQYWRSQSGSIHLGVSEGNYDVTTEDMIVLGNLLAQMYLIRVTDLHSENIIRSSPGVFYICDPETPMTPILGRNDKYTVFNTGIAPQTLVLDQNSSMEIGFVSKLTGALNKSERAEISRYVADQFKMMMEHLISIRYEIFTDICNIAQEKDMQFRVVLRPTQFYFHCMRLLHPLRLLSKKALSEANPLPLLDDFPIKTINEEMESLIDECIPICHVRSNGDFYVDKKKIGSITPPVDDLFTHLNQCSSNIDGVTASLRERISPTTLKCINTSPLANRQDGILIQLRDALLDAFNRERAGKWLATQPLPGDCYNVNAYNFGLYNGWLGAAIFLSGMAKHFGAEVDAMASREIVRSAAKYSEKDTTLATGSAGLIYAENMIGAIDGMGINANRPANYSGLGDSLDFLSGLSGIIYTLNRFSGRLDSIPGHVKLLDAFHEALGRDLIPERAYTSLAHGTSGIIMALASGNHLMPSSVKLLEGLLDVEDRNRDLQGWLDLRKKPPRPIVKWCHGSAGVGISRLAILNSPKLLPGDLCVRANRDLELSVGSVLSYVSDQTDYCCGNIGLADFLIEAGRYLNDSSLLGAAASKLELTVERVCSSNPFHGSSPRLNVGLMKGYSGLGYVLLRLRNPDLPYLWAV